MSRLTTRTTLWNWGKRRDDLDVTASLALWGCVAAFFHALQDINHQSPAVITALMLILMLNMENRQDAPLLKLPIRYAAAVFLLMLGIVSVSGNWKYTRADAALS